jgi:hypothetical protein
MLTPPLVRRRLARGMGADIDLFVESDSDVHSGDALEQAVRELRRLERILSPRRPDSELSALNRAGAMRVGPELWEVIDVALAGREATGARYEPLVRARRRAGDVPGVWRDPVTRQVQLAKGVTLDVGGLATAWCFDAVAEVLADAGPCLAGDRGAIAFRGVPECGPWVPLALERGGIAAVALRHRLRSADDLADVIVAAETAALAEIRARSLLAAGMPAAIREADALGFHCVLTPADGPARTFGAFSAPAN